MKCFVCGQPIEEGRKQGQTPRLAKYCLKCRAERRRARVRYTWRPEYDAYLKAHYFGGLNRRFRVLTRMVRLTGLPRWYIKRQWKRHPSHPRKRHLQFHKEPSTGNQPWQSGPDLVLRFGFAAGSGSARSETDA